MCKKILLSLLTVVVVVGGVATLSAYEAHVINVTAHIENALSVTPEEIPFGTVFPQEKLYKPLNIRMSDSFVEEDRVDDIEYKIVQKPKFKVMTALTEDALTGEDIIDVESIAGMEEGDFILIGPETLNFEYRRIKSLLNSSILLDSPLSYNHSAGETVMTIYEYLCTYLSKHPDGTPENDFGIDAPHWPPQCMDGWDNDGDQLIDYPADPECASFWDNDEAIPGDQPMVYGRLAKSEGDYEDIWTIDLVVPCFQGMCAQDYSWEEFGPPLPPELEGKTFGCDLWIEVTGISLPSAQVTVHLNPDWGWDTTNATYYLNGTDLDNLKSSDDNRYQTQSTWETSFLGEDEIRLTFPDISAGVTVNDVVLNFELQRPWSVFNTRLGIWDGSGWNYQLFLPSSPGIDDLLTINLKTDFGIDTATEVNNLIIRFQAIANPPDAYTWHDWVQVDVTYTP